MRIATLFAVISLTLTFGCLITGCARVTAETTFALYNPQTDLKFDQRLLGIRLPDSMCVNLRRGEGNSYLAKAGGLSWLVIFGDVGNKTSTPDAIHLVKIGKYDYFFAAPKPGESGTSFTGCCKVQFADDRITLHGLNLQTVTDDLLKHPDALKHQWSEIPPHPAPTMRPTTQPAEAVAGEPATNPTTFPTTEQALRNGDLKITDDPPAIRTYLVKHQDDADFFSEPVVMYRIAK